MDIREFAFEPKSQDSYWSTVYEKEFPLVIPGSQYIKLDPVPKQTIRECLDDFVKNLPGRPVGAPYLDSDEFYEDPSMHQLYSLRRRDVDGLPYKLEGEDYYPSLNIFFRNKSVDKGLDDILECIQESSILRSYADCRELDKAINSGYQEEFREASKKSRKIIEHDLKDVKKRIRRQLVRYQLLVLFDTLTQMSNKGYSPLDVLDEISFVEIFPNFSRRDPLVEEVREIF